MTWILVLEIPVVMAFGFVLGRVWPLHEVRSVWMADYEAEMGDFTPPTIGRIPTSCATAAGGRLYYPDGQPTEKCEGEPPVGGKRRSPRHNTAPASERILTPR